MSKHLMIFSDGGSRGNPGSAAIAFIIQSETGKTLAKSARCIGIRTNNQAEYMAILAALESAIALRGDTVTCYADSELVVKQLVGKYRVKNEELKKLWQEVQEKKEKFSEIKFVNVPRDHRVIQEVDKLVNQAMDTNTH